MARRSIKGTEGNWVEMQKDTFTNWINANLKQNEMQIEDLETGFEDGVKLVNLFELVSKKSLGRYAKNPKFPNQKLENVSIVLRAMEQDGIKLVSIGKLCSLTIICDYKLAYRAMSTTSGLHM